MAKNMTKESPSRPRQVDSKRFSITTLVQIRVADALGLVDAEDAVKVTTVIRFRTSNVAVYETLYSTVVQQNR